MPVAAPRVLIGALAVALLTSAAPLRAQTTSSRASPASAAPAIPHSAAPAPAAPTAATQPKFPQLTLTAGAWREVAQDRVAVTLYASHEAPEPGPAQAKVNEQLNPVLARLKERKDLEVQSAGYRSDPVWQDSRIVAWRARGAIRLTAEPSDRFNELIGELSTTLNVESVAPFLSREARLEVERSLIAEAVEAFRTKAEAAARALGYREWIVRSVSVNDSGHEPPQPMPKMMMARAEAADAAASMPIAVGRTTVNVSVGGTVVLLQPAPR
ncbi:MAG: SIMPL domain-containing protein [Limnobacter sp.]|nr:SIMPL domain-containing protein [Limnobacter sp.]